MIIFLIQTENKEIIYDFSLAIKESIKYTNWFYNQKKYDYIFVENINTVKLNKQYINNYIPVGSINFVINFYQKFHNIYIKPINIPAELLKKDYLGRELIESKDLKFLNLDPNIEVFIKSKYKVKDITEIIRVKDIPNGEFLISEIIDINNT